MKQTAVEYLESIINHCKKYGTSIEQIDIDEAKAMEKERMIHFAKYCLNNAKYLNFEKALFNVEEYYQIFKSE